VSSTPPSAAETLAALFEADTTDWEHVDGDLWRGRYFGPVPDCWRYAMLRDARYATVLVTFEAERLGIGLTEHITRKLEAKWAEVGT